MPYWLRLARDWFDNADDWIEYREFEWHSHSENEWHLRCDGEYVLTLIQSRPDGLGKGRCRITFEEDDVFLWLRSKSIVKAKTEAVKHLIKRLEKKTKKYKSWMKDAKTYIRTR